MPFGGLQGGGGATGGGGGGTVGIADPRIRPRSPGGDDPKPKKKSDPRDELARHIGRLRGMAEKDGKGSKAWGLYHTTLGAYGPEVGLDRLKKYGVSEDDYKEHTAYRTDVMGKDWHEKLAEGFMTIARPQQRLLQAVQRLNVAKDNVIGRVFYGEPSSDFKGGQATNFLTPLVGIRDASGGFALPGAINPFSKGGLSDHNINFRETMLQDAQAGGTAGDVADFAGMMATDPLNLVSFGRGQISRSVISALMREGEVELATKIGTATGRAALTEAEQETVRQVLTRNAQQVGVHAAADTAEQGAQGPLRRAINKANVTLWSDPHIVRGGGISTRLAERGKALLQGREALTGPELYAERGLEQAMRRGGGGLVVAGRTIPGTGGNLGSRTLERLGLPGWNPTLKYLNPQTANGLLRLQQLGDGFTRANFDRPLRAVAQTEENVDPAVGRAAAEWYQGAAHAPDDPATVASYEAMQKEMAGDAIALHDGLGLRFKVTEDDPYSSVQEMIEDVAKRNEVKVRGTSANDLEGMEPGHAMANPIPPELAKRLGLPEGTLWNDLFRVIHDLRGHAMIGNDFTRNGEEVAWAMHSQFFSPEALPAMTNETRMQNSYLNFSAESEASRAAGGEAVFPKQKMALPPPEFTRPVEDLSETIPGGRGFGRSAPESVPGESPAAAAPARKPIVGPVDAEAGRPPAPGTVRVFRGEGTPSQKGGSFFTDNAQQAANHAGGSGEVLSVDVPEDVWAQAQAAAREQGHVGGELPPEWAGRAMPHEGAPRARLFNIDEPPSTPVGPVPKDAPPKVESLWRGMAEYGEPRMAAEWGSGDELLDSIEEDYGNVGKWWGDENTGKFYGEGHKQGAVLRGRPLGATEDPADASGTIVRGDIEVDAVFVKKGDEWVELPLSEPRIMRGEQPRSAEQIAAEIDDVEAELDAAAEAGQPVGQLQEKRDALQAELEGRHAPQPAEAPGAPEGPVDTRGPVRAAREDTVKAAQDKLIEQGHRTLGPLRARAEKARAGAEAAQADLLDLQADLSAVLDNTPGTPSYGLGEKIGKARQKSAETRAAAERAEHVSQQMDQEYRTLDQQYHAAEGGRQEKAGELQDAVTPKGKGGEGRRPGFGEGRDLGRTEQSAAALKKERDRALRRAAIAKEQADAARAAADKAEEGLNGLYERLDAVRGSGDTSSAAEAAPGAPGPRSGDAVKPRPTFGMGKRMQRAEQRLRDAEKAAADAEWKYESSLQALRSEAPARKAEAFAAGERAGRETFLGAHPMAIDPRTGESTLGATTGKLVADPRPSLFGKDFADKSVGLKQRLGSTGVGKFARKGFIVREGLFRNLPGEAGREAAAGTGDVVTSAAAGYHQEIRQMMDRFSELTNKGGLSSADMDTIMHALETKGGIEALRKSGADDVLVQAAEEGRRILQRVTQHELDSGNVVPGQLRDLETYMHRSLTDAGKRALFGDDEGTTEMVNRFLREKGLESNLGTAGALRRRQIMPEATIQEVEDVLGKRLRDAGKLKEGETIYEHNPFKAIAKRVSAGEGAVAEANVLHGLSQVVDDSGAPLVLTARKSDEAGVQAAIESQAQKLGYSRVELPGDSNLVAYAHKDVMPEVQRLRSVVLNDDAMKAMEKAVDYVVGIFKRQAMFPLTGGAGSVSRNIQGNVISNWIRGVSNPALYGEAMGIQRLAARIALRAKETGEDFWTAADNVVHTGVDATENAGRLKTAIPVAGDTRRLTLLKLAREHGIFDEGYYMVDMGDDDLARLASTRGEQIRKSLNPVGRESMLTKPLQELNQLAEQNGRLAHFIDKLDKLGDPIAASRSVKETLFDYSELTPFERRFMRRINAFYTFSRKNLPLYARMLKESPGRVRRPILLEQELFGGGDGQNDRKGGLILPDYATQAGQMLLNPGLAQLATGNPNTPAMAGVDMPLMNALDTIRPFVEEGSILAGQLPGLSAMTKDLRPRGGNWLDRQAEVFRNTIGLTSGTPAEVARFAYEMATKTDSFTGAPLTKSDGTLAVDKVDGFLMALDALAPGVSRSIGLYDTARGTGIGRNRNKDRGYSGVRQALARALLGIQLTPIDEKADAGSAWAAYYEVDARLKAKYGDKLPTWQELVKDGFVPDVANANRKRKRIAPPAIGPRGNSGGGGGGGGSFGGLGG